MQSRRWPPGILEIVRDNPSRHVLCWVPAHYGQRWWSRASVRTRSSKETYPQLYPRTDWVDGCGDARNYFPPSARSPNSRVRETHRMVHAAQGVTRHLRMRGVADSSLVGCLRLEGGVALHVAVGCRWFAPYSERGSISRTFLLLLIRDVDRRPWKRAGQASRMWSQLCFGLVSAAGVASSVYAARAPGS